MAQIRSVAKEITKDCIYTYRKLKQKNQRLHYLSLYFDIEDVPVSDKKHLRNEIMRRLSEAGIPVDGIRFDSGIRIDIALH